jgi:hypothetical protein
MLAKIDLPIKGICLIQEFCHRGGVSALSTKVSLGVEPGRDIAGVSGTIIFGQSMDQSMVFGGSALRSLRFW